MSVSIHLCDKKLAFAKTADDGSSTAVLEMDVEKLKSGINAFAHENTGTDEFAAGALAMFTMLEACSAGDSLSPAEVISAVRFQSAEPPQT